MNQRSRPHLRTASTVPAILHNMAHILGNSLYKSLLKVVLIPLYQMSSFAHAAEIIESMSMTVQPVLCFHVIAGFCIDIIAAWQHGHKQIGAAPLSGNGIVDRDCISGTVHLDCISRLVLNAHGSFCKGLRTKSWTSARRKTDVLL